MRRRSKHTIPTKYILMFFTVICVAFMYISFTLNIGGGPLNTVAGTVFGPMQRGINTVGLWIQEKNDYLKNLEQVKAENAELKAQVEELKEELNAAQLNQYELTELRELLELDEQYDQYEKLAAHVTGKDTGNWFSVFVIDKGEKDGVQKDMNVIADGGLAGIVIDVGPHYAKVRSIIDDISSVSSMVLSTSDLCIVSGDLQMMTENQTIEIKSLNDQDNKVKTGDQIVTSSVSSRFLPGILVGYVDSLEMDANNLTKSGTVIPAVDFEHLQNVLVILETKDDGTSE